MESVHFQLQLNEASVKRRTLHGRDYIIADATLIVPGVLNGSKGALYYPPEEVAKDPWAWNGMPIVGYHPVINGVHVSGRDPDVLASHGLGNVYRAKAGDKLSAELWFDVGAVKNFDKTLQERDRILPRLEAGKPIELSTGLFTDNDEAPPNSAHNGKPYSFIARNYRPDHLAVLPDQKGACSIDDGCGVNVNAEKCPKCGGMIKDGVCSKCGYLVENYGKYGNPRAKDTGKFKPFGWSGSATGPNHDHPESVVILTHADHLLGADAKQQLETTGHNPASWVADEDTWEKAKTEASKSYSETDDAYWAVVTSIYKKMGGEVKDTTKNSNPTITEDTNMATREQNIAVLTANCDCWKGKEKVLANKDVFTDEDLEKLKANLDRTKKLEIVANSFAEVRKAVKAPDTLNVADTATFVVNAMKKADEEDVADQGVDEDMEDAEGNLIPSKKKKKDMTKNQQAVDQTPAAIKQTDIEASFAKSLGFQSVGHLKATLNVAKGVELQRRTQLVQQLVENIADDSARQSQAKWLMDKDVGELERLVTLMPVRNQEQPIPAFNYVGIGGGAPQSGGKDDSDNILPVFNMDWDDQAAPDLRKKQPA